MRLTVNIDHVATLREARGGVEPDPVTAAHICELAGAEGIVCHLREDRRHINDRDVRLLRETIKTKLDLEMAATPEIINIAIETLPELATLVPERRQELTTEGGLDVRGQKHYLRDVVKELQKHEIEVSLFVDPIPEQIQAAHEVGANKVEIHTGEYANARSPLIQQALVEKIRAAAKLAAELGMGVNAGHGLNYINLVPIKHIAEIEEVSIGHALISRGVFVGLEQAVKEMLDLVK
ncbi:MAG: pyridoxine 5'-phosphate synthase [Ignavibacteriae bacterium]|nr:pyridoxine 5'-phosphate synthase [Ignavibacteriota bacterium]